MVIFHSYVSLPEGKPSHPWYFNIAMEKWRIQFDDLPEHGDVP
jgi:hypothetical protein